MKKCYLDSNVLIYFKDEASPQHNLVSQKMADLLEQDYQFFVSPLVLDEFLHGARRTFLLKAQDFYISLATALKNILDIPTMAVVNPPTDISDQKQVVTLMEKYSLRPRDAYHLLIMQSNDIEAFATFDADFRRVFAAKILKKVL